MSMFNSTNLLKVSLVGLVGFFAQQVVAVESFGKLYSPVAGVASDQAQVVYYRAVAAGAKSGAANVYVDREFHTGLLPDGYTAFCVAAGSHSLGAYLNDAPQYRGKNSEVYTANLEGGKTYFLKAREGNDSTPQGITREEAERELASMREQIHALSRASAVVPCNYQPAAAQKDYALSADVLFKFGKAGYGDISPEGRKAVVELATQIKNDNTNLSHIEVIGHTDPIGSAKANQKLGLERAQTVRKLLIDGGLPAALIWASSKGSSESLSSGCSGTRSEQIACYAEDRRVVVRVYPSH